MIMNPRVTNGSRSIQTVALPQEVNEQRSVNKDFLQIRPADSLLSSVQATLKDIRNQAIEETMESMSLAIGSRMSKKGGTGKLDSSQTTVMRKQNMLFKLVQKKTNIPAIDALLEDFPSLGDQRGDILEELREEGLSEGAIALLLGHLLQGNELSEKRRRRLEASLYTLLDTESEWLLELLGLLEYGELPNEAIKEIRRFYEQSRKQDEEDDEGPTLLDWFQEVKLWSDRRQRLKLIIRALGIELSMQGDYNNVEKLAMTITELKRLFYFLSLEEQATAMAKGLQRTSDEILEEILLFLGQSWVYPEWVEGRLDVLRIPSHIVPSYLRCLESLMKFLSLACFQSEEQKNQLIGAIRVVQDRREGICNEE